MKEHLKSARTLAIVIAALCVTVLATSLHLRSLAAAAQLAPTSAELATALTRVGLNPEALAAAGVSSNSTQEVVAAAFGWLIDEQTALDGADQAYANAKRTHDQLLRRVRSGRASAEEITALQQAKSSLASAGTQRQGILDSLLAAATANLSGAQVSTLDRIRLNHDWKQPTEFLAVDRSQEEWVALRDALANERISAEDGVDPDAAAQTLLAQLRGDGAVSAAKANLDANLALITATWVSAAGL